LHPTSNTAEVATIAPERRAPNGGKFNVGYFGNWVIYDRAFTPSDIPVSTLTHILYSFADTNPSDGTCFLTDLFADQQKMYPDDTASSGTNLYGNLKQFYKIKQANRGLKVVLSVGGWTYSQAGHFNFVTNPVARANFVKTAVKLL
jgi:chitinase